MSHRNQRYPTEEGDALLGIPTGTPQLHSDPSTPFGAAGRPTPLRVRVCLTLLQLIPQFLWCVLDNCLGGDTRPFCICRYLPLAIKPVAADKAKDKAKDNKEGVYLPAYLLKHQDECCHLQPDPSQETNSTKTQQRNSEDVKVHKDVLWYDVHFAAVAFLSHNHRGCN